MKSYLLVFIPFLFITPAAEARDCSRIRDREERARCYYYYDHEANKQRRYDTGEYDLNIRNHYGPPPSDCGLETDDDDPRCKRFPQYYDRDND